MNSKNAACAFLVLLACATACTAFSTKIQTGEGYTLEITALDGAAAVQSVEPMPITASGQLCNVCTQMATQGLQILMNYILNVGVLGGCSELCGALPEKLEKEVCAALCDAAGLYAFIQAIQKADLDPIYYCQVLKTCPEEDCPADNPSCVSVDSLDVSPDHGALAATFTGLGVFTAENETGTGEIRFSITPIGSKAQGIGSGQVFTTLPQGRYQIKLAVDPSEVNKQAQKAQDTPPFRVGQSYEMSFTVCEGECGSTHPFSQVFGTQTGKFAITSEHSDDKNVKVSIA